MSPNRGGRPSTHGTSWLALRMTTNRLDERTRRRLRKLQAELASNPVEAVRALAQGHLARLELLLQQSQAALLADETSTAGAFLIALSNAWRRQAELVTLLEADEHKPAAGITCGRCNSSFNQLGDYIAHPCAGAPPASVSGAAVGEHTAVAPSPTEEQS